MRALFPLFLLAVVLTIGCTRPPYSKPGQELSAIDNDFTDCYSQASLTANTPPFPESPLQTVDNESDACMIKRGYQSHIRLF